MNAHSIIMLLLRTKSNFDLTTKGKQVLGLTVKTLVQMSPYGISSGYALGVKI